MHKETRDIYKNMSEILIFTIMFLNTDISVNACLNVFKFSVFVLRTIIEGTVSQIFILGPRSNYM